MIKLQFLFQVKKFMLYEFIIMLIILSWKKKLSMIHVLKLLSAKPFSRSAIIDPQLFVGRRDDAPKPPSRMTAPDAPQNCLINQFKKMRGKYSSNIPDSQTCLSSFEKRAATRSSQGLYTSNPWSQPWTTERVWNFGLNPYEVIKKLYELYQ